MMKKAILICVQQSLIYLFFGVFFSTSSVMAIIIGSDSVLSRQSFVKFPSKDNDNIILGFAAMQEGFLLEDSSTKCTYSSYFPVAGSIELNSGTLCLATDLIVSNMESISSFGNIEAKNTSLEFPSNFESLGTPGDPFYTCQDVKITLNSNVTFECPIIFKGMCSITGHGHTLSIGKESHFIIADDSTLTIHDVSLHGVSEKKIYCNGDSSKLVLQSMIWSQVGDFTFFKGCLSIQDKVQMSSSDDAIFNFESTCPIVVLKDSLLKFNKGFTFYYNPLNNDQDLLQMTNESSGIVFDASILRVVESGLIFTNGFLEIKNNPQFFADTNSSGSEDDESIGSGISIGNGIASNDCRVVFDYSSTLCMAQGALKYKNVLESSWNMINDRSILKISYGAILALYENLNLGDGRAAFEDQSILALAAGKDITGSVCPNGYLFRLDVSGI